MQFYFIRHAQSQNNLLYETTGSGKGRSHDPELTEVGRCQAKLLADFLSRSYPIAAANDRDPQNLAGFDLTHLYCSLMVRAVATGSIIAEVLDLPLVAWQDAHESGGIYLDDEVSGQPIGQPGNARSYFEEHYPDLLLPDTLSEDGWWNRPYEELPERPLRTQRFLHDLMERHGGGDRVAVVSHGGFYNHLLAALLDFDQKDSGPWFVLNNAAITRIDFTPDGVVLVYANRVDFLPKEIIT